MLVAIGSFVAACIPVISNAHPILAEQPCCIQLDDEPLRARECATHAFVCTALVEVGVGA